jgi:2,3-bisphosphoglycerate-independent phosphoglycerate mutase
MQGSRESLKERWRADEKEVQAVKIIVVVIDGMSDEPLAALDGRTPLEIASLPNLRELAARGHSGALKTTFDGFPVESALCMTGLLGYDPVTCYPKGRASLEALGRGIFPGEQDLILRCNIVTFDREREVITDFTGAVTGDIEARALLSALRFPCPDWELYQGQRYRHILILRNARACVEKVVFFEPHMNLGVPLGEIMPRGSDGPSESLMAVMRAFMRESAERMATVRAAPSGTGTMIWPWSPSVRPSWQPFKERTGLRGAIVCGVDFLKGIAVAAGLHCEVIPGATGEADTDYQAKGTYVLRQINDFDFILSHINAPDEIAHRGDYRAKAEALEKIDRLIIGPLFMELCRNHEDDFCMLVCGDHCTRSSDGKHTDAPVPYVICGKGIAPDGGGDFSEAFCKDVPALSSLALFERLMSGWGPHP